MQLSAANLLIASQQLAKPRMPAEAGAQFAEALKKDGGVEAAGFEPMAFKKAAPLKAADAPASIAQPTGYGAASAIGANLDIRV